jgi:pentatricopeptide repeat protein
MWRATATGGSSTFTNSGLPLSMPYCNTAMQQPYMVTPLNGVVPQQTQNQRHDDVMPVSSDVRRVTSRAALQNCSTSTHHTQASFPQTRQYSSGVENSGQRMNSEDASASITLGENVNDTLKVLVERIRESGPVKQRYLQQVYGMCSDKDELERALGLTRLNYLARGGLQQHDPFSHKTFSLLLQQAMKLDAPEIAKRVLLQSTEFGFSPANTRLYNGVLIYHSKQMDLRSMLEMYEMMKRSGPVPDSETCFILVKGCVDAGRADIAQAIVSEFDNAGKRVRDGVRLYIQQHVA